MVALQTAKTTQETAMNHGTKTIALPELTANLLRDGGCLIDNLFGKRPINPSLFSEARAG